MRKHWKLLTALGAVILVIAVAVVLLNPPTPAAKDDPSALQASGKFGFPVSTIKIGEGGTKTASDGKTIIGYNGTCDSAAQAAANYTPLIEDVNVSTWAQQKKTLSEVGNAGAWTEKVTSKGDLLTTSKELSSLSFDGGWVYRSDVAAGGLHRIASCEPKKTAVVQVFFGATSANVKAAPSAFFQTATFALVWDGDWKVADAAIVANGQNFDGRVKDSGPMSVGTNMDDEATPVLRDDLVNAFFKDKTREGWVEYANAKR
ncbi:hypothetical protein J2T10_004135 [Paenarthrobacter nicotinovorans]|uniref:Uncharacterized protein n=1 Tax=Paenarthrobacter nicotinovorans TaxID=29320 RepID=A0ABT9TST0_PAENI|nr:hypothetical protein [Paenarthrobacter nicotinovorans]MDQ0104460.1 hypothetical protein [Paenarthrobacter nicotinovorans]